LENADFRGPTNSQSLSGDAGTVLARDNRHGFFVVVFGATIFLGTVMVVGTFGGDPSNELTANGRAGRVARTLRDGTLCHYMIFDNKTAQTVEDRIGRCDENRPAPKQERPATFTWGK
jgi:hypothetical protein